MIAVIRSRRIGRTGSLVTTMRCSVSTPKSCVAGSRSPSARNECPPGYRPARRERRGDVSLPSTAGRSVRCSPVFESVNDSFLPGTPCFTGPNLMIFSENSALGVFVPHRQAAVDADAVRNDRRAVAAAVDGDLQRIAQGAVAGSAGRG